MLFLQNTVFSTWLTKEISVASNIKNRSNRQNVQRLLTILNQKFSNINLNIHYQLGIFCFVGINEYGEEIIEFIEPDVKLDLFYYSCSNKFETVLLSKYIGIKYSGTIIFANGEECMAYQFVRGEFVKIFGLNGNLVKRHNKGGYSANRFARIAEESRHLYVVRICDRLKDLVVNQETLTSKSSSKSSSTSTFTSTFTSIPIIQNNETSNNWIFGSEEIIQMILKQSPIKLSYGGFLDFNSSTISNRKYWLDFLTQKENYDSYYKEILDYLATNPDILDFDPKNKNSMKYFMVVDKNIQDNKQCLEKNTIPLLQSSKYYSKLCMFEYIGVKYYNYDIDNNDD